MFYALHQTNEEIYVCIIWKYYTNILEKDPYNLSLLIDTDLSFILIWYWTAFIPFPFVVVYKSNVLSVSCKWLFIEQGLWFPIDIYWLQKDYNV